ncbi:MAG: hypothetical protein ACLRRT_05955 [Ruthenibacterium lactatiformans]
MQSGVNALVVFLEFRPGTPETPIAEWFRLLCMRPRPRATDLHDGRGDAHAVCSTAHNLACGEKRRIFPNIPGTAPELAERYEFVLTPGHPA